MMKTKVHFTQGWISRITSGQEDDVVVVGADFEKPPSEGEIASVMQKVSEEDAVREMIRRRWFSPGVGGEKKKQRGIALQEFLFSQAPNIPSISVAPLFRRQIRTWGLPELISTLAWLRRISTRAIEIKDLNFHINDLYKTSIIKHLVHLSADELGPRKAISYLERLGVRVIVESSLPSMKIDGASFVLSGFGPVIGLTLRYDRLDSFWFTLMHEIAHLILHLASKPNEVFLDTLEYGDFHTSETEIEANAFAKDSFIPRDVWNRSDAYRLGNKASIMALSNELKISPAIIAGRLRFERKIYDEFSQLVGNGKVRALLLQE